MVSSKTWARGVEIVTAKRYSSSDGGSEGRLCGTAIPGGTVMTGVQVPTIGGSAGRVGQSGNVAM